MDDAELEDDDQRYNSFDDYYPEPPEERMEERNFDGECTECGSLQCCKCAPCMDCDKCLGVYWKDR